MIPDRTAALDPAAGAPDPGGAGRTLDSSTAAGGESILVTVLDHSNLGCRVVSAGRLEVGTGVVLDLAGAGKVEAEIAAFDGLAHECRFLEPLTDEGERSGFAGRPAVKLTIAASALDFSDGPGSPPPGRWPPLVRLAIHLAGGVAAWLLVLWLVFWR